MLRLRFVLSATTFFSYNPDIPKGESRTRSGDTPYKIHEELRRLLAFSVPTFSSYNPDNAKNRVMPRIRLAAEDETPKSLDERRKDLSISYLKTADEVYP